jgi:tetratricopeptide (TPR) repeat protein
VSAVAEFRRLADDENALRAQPVPSLVLLARQLKYGVDDLERAAQVLRRAATLHPGDYWVHHDLALALGANAGVEANEMVPRPEEAVRHLTAAVAIRPRSSIVHNNLGPALMAHGKLDEAARELREAIRFNKDYGNAHNNLGAVLLRQEKWNEAAAECREAIRLQPGDAVNHANLGIALLGRGALDEAIAECRTAIRLEPDLPLAHYNLSNALKAQGKFDQAIVECREAIRLKPDDNAAHSNLAATLALQGKLGESIAECREAIRLKPDDAFAHVNLGSALGSQGKREDACDAFREAIRLKPDLAEAHYGLGNSLRELRRFDEAVAECSEAIRLKPNDAMAHLNLGGALRSQGKLELALAEYRSTAALAQAGSELGRAMPEMIRQLERQIALARRLEAVLQGKDKPANPVEGLAFAQLCYDTQRYSAAARLWAEALMAEPTLGDDRRSQHRYNAACAAARAAMSASTDEPLPDETEKARRRAQALDWLQDELTAWSKLLESSPPNARLEIAQILKHWRQDKDLAGIRDLKFLAKLPEKERALWHSLWAKVEGMLQRAQAQSP